MNPMHSQKISIVHFFATKKLTQSQASENARIQQFFVNQSEASKDGVLGVHFRPKEFK